MEVWANITEGNPARIVSAGNMALQEGAGAVVVRMDAVKEWEASTANFISHGIKGKTVASLRSLWQGGFFNGDEEDREEKLSMLIDADFDLIELEADLEAVRLRNLVTKARERNMSVMFLFNSFAGTLPAPALHAMVAEYFTEGDVFSFGAPVKSRQDIDSLIGTAGELSKYDLEVNPAGMGSYGYFVSLLAPLLDARFVYGTPETLAKKGGDVPAISELHSVWQSYSHSIAHIQSPAHAVFFGGLAHNRFYSPNPLLYNLILPYVQKESVYVPLLWGKRSVEDIIDLSIDMEFKGFHVEAGIQKAIIDAMDTVDKAANHIHAVDTVIINGEELTGLNTRYHGYMGLSEEFPMNPREHNVLIIGSGGEARSAVQSFIDMNSNVSLATPEDKDARDAEEIFGSDIMRIPWSKRKNASEDADIIVIPPVLKKREEPSLDLTHLRGKKVLIDLQTKELEHPGNRRPGDIMRFTSADMFPYHAAVALSLWTGNEIGSEDIFRDLAKADFGGK